MQTESPLFAIGMLAAGLAAAVLLHAFQLKKNGLPVRTAAWTALLGAVLALAGAKIGFLLHNLGADLWEGSLGEALALEPEKLSFAGGCGGFAAAAVLAGRLGSIRPVRALDLFTVPGCALLFLARIAEGGMGSIGLGNAVEDGWYRFFPVVMEDSWGDAYLSVFLLEAMLALVCLFTAAREQGKPDRRDGIVFEKTAVVFLGVQLGLEMLLQYPYIRTFLISFINLDQVLYAVFLAVIIVRRCVKSGKKWPGIVTAALLGLSALVQFFRDKPYLFTRYLPEEAEIWLQDRLEIFSLAAFVLISAGAVITGLKAVNFPDKIINKTK